MDSLLHAINAGILTLACFLAVISIYMLATVVGAWLHYFRNESQPSAESHRVAFVIPAHNEGTGIKLTLKDLLEGLDYPRELIQVFVIADNCSDNTAEIVTSTGATVAVRNDPEQPGKGQALDWFLREYRSQLEQFDLIAFVDADMRVDAQFLHAMSASFNSGAKNVVQARYTMTPHVPSWPAAIAFASFGYVNHVRPAGKSYFGGTCRLNGSGMVFRKDLILSTGWPMHSIAEDVEFGNELMLQGIRVHYEPQAIVVSEVPQSLRQVAVQQSRWETGKLYVIRRYLGPVLARLMRDPRYLWLDMFLDQLIPPLSVVAFMAILGAGTALITDSLLVWLFTGVILVFAGAVLTGLVQLRAPARVWKLLCMAPVFLVWKLVLMLGVLLRPRETQWKRTPRKANEKT